MGRAVDPIPESSAKGNNVTEKQHPFSTSEIQAALDEPIDVPDTCVCAYVRVEPYHLIQRRLNPDCTAHTPEDDGEIEKERD